MGTGTKLIAYEGMGSGMRTFLKRGYGDGHYSTLSNGYPLPFVIKFMCVSRSCIYLINHVYHPKIYCVQIKQILY